MDARRNAKGRREKRRKAWIKVYKSVRGKKRDKRKERKGNGCHPLAIFSVLCEKTLD